jgi:NAD(P)-dependent dehydrogenase (short-subunit alcohol dehydrogenase family)
MSKELKGLVAAITGASKGIGPAIAEQLAVAGAVGVVNYPSSKGGAEAFVERIRQADGKAVAVQAVVSNQPTASSASGRLLTPAVPKD